MTEESYERAEKIQQEIEVLEKLQDFKELTVSYHGIGLQYTLPNDIYAAVVELIRGKIEKLQKEFDNL